MSRRPLYVNGEKPAGVVRTPFCVCASAKTLPTIEVPWKGFSVSLPEYLFWKYESGKFSASRGPPSGWRVWLIWTRSYAPKNQTLSLMTKPPRSAPHSWRTSLLMKLFGPASVFSAVPSSAKSGVTGTSQSARMPVSL